MLSSYAETMQVSEVTGQDVVCTIKNSATLAGSLFTLHVSQVHIDLPTLTDKDKEVISVFLLACLNESLIIKYV